MVAQNGNGDLGDSADDPGAPRAVRPGRARRAHRHRVRGDPGSGVRPLRTARLVPSALRALGWSGSNSRSSGRTHPAGRRGHVSVQHLLLRDAVYESLPKEKRVTSTSASPSGSRLRCPRSRRSAATTSSRRTDTGPSFGPSTSALWNSRAEPRDCSQQQATRVTPCRCSATIHFLDRVVSLLPDGDREAVALYLDLWHRVDGKRGPPATEQLFRDAAWATRTTAPAPAWTRPIRTRSADGGGRRSSRRDDRRGGADRQRDDPRRCPWTPARCRCGSATTRRQSASYDGRSSTRTPSGTIGSDRRRCGGSHS